MINSHSVLYQVINECIYVVINKSIPCPSVIAGDPDSQEVNRMADPKAGLGDQDALSKDTPGSKWRNALMAIGFIGFIVALFIGASMKETAGGLPKFIALGASALIVISGIWALIDWISTKWSRVS